MDPKILREHVVEWMVEDTLKYERVANRLLPEHPTVITVVLAVPRAMTSAVTTSLGPAAGDNPRYLQRACDATAELRTYGLSTILDDIVALAVSAAAGAAAGQSPPSEDSWEAYVTEAAARLRRQAADVAATSVAAAESEIDGVAARTVAHLLNLSKD